MEPVCVACCSFPESKQRRNLIGVVSRHLLPMLREIVEHCFPDPADQQYFGLGHQSSDHGVIVCKKCFRQLEKLLKLRKEQKLLKKEIENGVERVGQHFGIAASTSTVSTPTKRPAKCDYNAPPKKRRLTYDTPEKEALASIVCPQTPVVSVSFLFCIC